MSAAFFLHDVGKILVDENILKKEGPPTSVEFAVMQKHSSEIF